MRHVQVRDTQVREGIDHGRSEGGDGADVGRLGHTLGTQRVVRRRRHGVVGFPVRGFHEGGQEVVHQRVAHEVALRVEGHLLAHGHGKTFGQAAVDLAVDDHRVDAGAAVVQRVEATDFGFTRGAVDVHHAQVDAEREGEVRWVVVVHGLQARLHAIGWQVVSLPSHVGHGFELAVVALDLEAVDFPVEVGFVDFEHVGRDFAGLGVDLSRGQGDGGTGHGGRTRTIGAQAVRRGAGVALFDLNHLGRNAQLGGDDLRVGGLVTLALRDRAHAGDGTAGGVDADFAGVEHAHAQDVAHLGRTGTDHFGEGDQANAHQRGAVGIGAFGRLLGAQAFVVHSRQHLVQRGLVVTRVVLKTEGAGVGELVFLDEVLGADLGLVHAQFLRQHVDHALDQIHRFGHAE